MPSSKELTLSTSATLLTLDKPANRVIVTMQGSAEEVYVTTDGSNPASPSSTTDANIRALPAVVGAQVVCQVPQPSDHMILPTIRLAAATGTPTVIVEW